MSVTGCSRGLAELDASKKVTQVFLEDFPYAEDGLLVWNALVDYFTGYLNLYYSDSGAGGKPEVAYWRVAVPCIALLLYGASLAKEVPMFWSPLQFGLLSQPQLAGGGGRGAGGVVDGSKGVGAPRQEGGLDRTD